MDTTRTTAEVSASGADELALRRRLGIPDDATRALLLAESTHWDPDWLLTSEEYFRWRISRTLGRALRDCVAEPRRVFDIECIFFLRMYWERVPRDRDTIRALLDEGRLRLTGSGITTPDTLLPSAEAIMRDFLLGQEWLRSIGVTAEPRLAYFPDNFGHSPALPSLLRAMGFEHTAITRIDGMYFVGCDWELPSAFPRPGSSAELLERERTLDFVWRGPDGAEVLCHWNAFGYGQGELLAHSGITRAIGLPFAVPHRSDRHVARRIERFAAQLEPLSRTPYLLCPIGYDFSMPIPELVRLCDRYNELHYPDSGTWVVNAGLDDYLALVECRRAELPVLELDPNPYWTGFYASRPSLKRRAHRLVESLLQAEHLALASADPSTPLVVQAALARAWDVAVIANHHDFVTGTSPDRVYTKEQLPWLESAQRDVDRIVDELASTTPWHAAETAVAATPPAWRWEHDRLVVETDQLTCTLDASLGGAIVSLRDAATGRELLDGPSNDLVAFRDTGGLWRMGQEFKGGAFEEVDRASDRPARMTAAERGDLLEVEIVAELDGLPARRWLWVGNASPVLRMRSEATAGFGRTVLTRFDTAVSATTLTTDVPGGVAQRPARKIYEPTFWSASSFAHVVDEGDGVGMGLLLERSGSVSLQPPGRVELVAARNATMERAFGVLPIPGHPARGTEPGAVTLDYAVVATAHGRRHEYGLSRLARHVSLGEVASPAVSVDGDDVLVVAAKTAHRGDGIVVRLSAPTATVGSRPVVTLRYPGRNITEASLCDARERDLYELPVLDGVVEVPMPGTLATVRIRAGTTP